jgi:NADH-quinone oxidoreductase subunit M
MALVMLGMFALNPVGIKGSIVQQINHGISTGALFLIVGVVYERRHTRQISEYGGLSKVMPLYAAIFCVMMLSSIGLPALNGFVGEFLILQGIFTTNMVWAAFAASGIVLGAAYMLWLYQRTMFGKIENPKNENLPDLNLREAVVFVPLIIMAVWIGIYPTPFLDRLDTSVNRVIARVSPQYIEHLAAKPADCAQTVAATSKFTQPACGETGSPEGTVPAGVPGRDAATGAQQPAAQPASHEMTPAEPGKTPGAPPAGTPDKPAGGR